MSSEHFKKTSLHLVRLKIFEWIKCLRRHLHQIQGNSLRSLRIQECTQRWIWNLQLRTVQLSNNKYINGSWEVRLTWLNCNQRCYIWIFGWTLREDIRLAFAHTRELFFDLHVPFQLSAKKTMQMPTGTWLTTAIRRRLLFLREGGRLYTGYHWSCGWNHCIDRVIV